MRCNGPDSHKKNNTLSDHLKLFDNKFVPYCKEAGRDPFTYNVSTVANFLEKVQSDAEQKQGVYKNQTACLARRRSPALSAMLAAANAASSVTGVTATDRVISRSAVEKVIAEMSMAPLGSVRPSSMSASVNAAQSAAICVSTRVLDR